MRDAITAPLSPAERVIVDADLEAVFVHLGKQAFETASSEGRAMTLEQAVAYALDEPPSAPTEADVGTAPGT